MCFCRILWRLLVLLDVFSVAFVSFILPPLFYAILDCKRILCEGNVSYSVQGSYQNGSGKLSTVDPSHDMVALILHYHLFDCGMVILGILATITTTYLTFQDLKK